MAWFDMSTSSLDIDVVQGQQYTFDITNVTGDGDLASRGILGDTNNPYAGGQAYAGGYNNPANWDLVFQTEISTGNVPEPASIALAAIALCSVAAVRRKRA